MKSENFKLRPFIPREGQVQKAILDALAYEVGAGRVIWYGRFNSGRIWRKGSDKGMYASIRYWMSGIDTTRGFPDIAGQLCDGRALYLEIKRPGKKAGPEQREFMARVLDARAVGGVVDSADQAIEIVRGAFDE